MAKSKTLTGAYEALPKIAKILIQIFCGAIFGGVYRIVRFVEKKNIITLVVGIICLCSGVGNMIAWVLDLYTEITKDRIIYFAD